MYGIRPPSPTTRGWRRAGRRADHVSDNGGPRPGPFRDASAASAVRTGQKYPVADRSFGTRDKPENAMRSAVGENLTIVFQTAWILRAGRHANRARSALRYLRHARPASPPYSSRCSQGARTPRRYERRRKMNPLIPHRGNGYILSRDLSPKLVLVASCKPLGRETRKHPPGQVHKLEASLDRFGFVLPILIDPEQRVVAGWGLVLAARQLGLTEVPAVTVTDVSEAELRALRLALNRLSEESVWDRAALTPELSEILELAPDIALEVSGFEMGEIDALLDGDGLDQEDELPPIEAAAAPATRPGDLCVLGDPPLLCGAAL